MTKTKFMKWKLKQLPDGYDVSKLVEQKVITPQEAREMLFSEETGDTKSLQQEIKFLRKLVEKLSSYSQTVEIIREIEVPYRRYHWYNPYDTWCGASYTTTASDNTMTAGTAGASSFSSISTF